MWNLNFKRHVFRDLACDTLTWLTNGKVRGCLLRHVEYFLNDGFGESGGAEQDRPFPLCPLRGDGTVGDQAQTVAQDAVWVCSFCSQKERRISINAEQLSCFHWFHFNFNPWLFLMSICWLSPHEQWLLSELLFQYFHFNFSERPCKFRPSDLLVPPLRPLTQPETFQQRKHV